MKDTSWRPARRRQDYSNYRRPERTYHAAVAQPRTVVIYRIEGQVHRYGILGRVHEPIFRTHRLHSLQWCVLSGLGAQH